MKIIRYRNNSDITIEFQDEHKFQIDTIYQNFKRSINNPYDVRIYGKGYMGVGKYSYQNDKNINRAYDIWKNMLCRCYSDRYRYKALAYEDCIMCDDWHNLQNFCEWYYANYYDVGDGKRMHIDKDIKIKGNKVYCHEACIIVPQRINMIFMSKPNQYNLPSGISLTSNNKYYSTYNGKKIKICDTLEEAVELHDAAKRIHIKEVVNEYGNKIPDNVKEIILNW